MYDPIKRTEMIRKIVCRDVNLEERKYYRARADRWYGGIATFDTVGCNLICKFCWSWNIITKPEKIGRFYKPERVVDQLIHISDSRGFGKARISGGEPTISRDHLLLVIKRLKEKRPNLLFILETNGVLIGNDESYAKDLARFENLHVRLSLKGCDEKEFSELTGATPKAFNLQIKALEYLSEYDVSCHPSVTAFFSSKEARENLRKRLHDISPKFSRELEMEELILYPPVRSRLLKSGLLKG